MIKNKTIICFASGYDAPPTSKHHVMHLLSEENRVLWVNYHASRIPGAKGSDLKHMGKKIIEIFKGMKKPKKNLYVLTPLVIPLPGNEFIKKLNKKLLIRQIGLALRKIRKGEVQLWTFTPEISYILGEFKEEKRVYYCVDDHSEFSGYDREQVLRDEKELCQRSDLVITTSMALQNKKEKWNKNTILVPHGVDFNHFNKAVTKELPCPEEISRIPEPRIGFFGLIRDWINLDLIAETAKNKKDWSFILIGDTDSSVDSSKYKKIKNMYFLGRKKYEDLPGYCRHLNAGLIPFKVNNLTQAVNPIKLREYLSAGLPVVSTPMAEVEKYGELVQIAGNMEEFSKAIEKSIKDTNEKKEKRINAMKKETWPEKLNLISAGLS